MKCSQCGAVAPGKVCPSGPVPIIGSTNLSGSGACANKAEAANKAVAPQSFIMVQQYSISDAILLAAQQPKRFGATPPFGIDGNANPPRGA